MDRFVVQLNVHSVCPCWMDDYVAIDLDDIVD